MGKRIAGTRGGRKGAGRLNQVRPSGRGNHPSFPAGLEQDVGRKGAPVLESHFVEGGNYRFARINGLDDVRFQKDCAGIVICSVPLFLKQHEMGREVLDALREAGDQLRVPAGVLCQTMFEQAINLTPRGLMTIRAKTADQGIGTVLGECMEQGIIGRADCTPQIGFPYTMTTPLFTLLAGQLPGRLD